MPIGGTRGDDRFRDRDENAVIAWAEASAPVRVTDVGGWTDTWFGAPGCVCNLAVGPGVTVRASLVPLEGAEVTRPVQLIAPDLGEDHRFGPSAEFGWAMPAPSRHPLLEHGMAAVLEHDPLPAGTGLHVTVSAGVPPGASLGTSASVLVSLIAAVDALVTGAVPDPADLAERAHQVETERAGRQAGIQDHWAASFGGASLLTITHYPDVVRQAIPVSAATRAELNRRMITVIFGAHDSSAIHAQVIASLGSGTTADGRARNALRRLADLAPTAANYLRGGDIDGWARTLVEATVAQGELHRELIGPAHQQAITLARRCGAVGWKVNGAGGEGGSLTIVGAEDESTTRIAEQLVIDHPDWRVTDLQVAGGVAVHTGTNK